MKTQQLLWTAATGWSSSKVTHAEPPTFVWIFGGRAALEDGKALATLAELFPRDRFFGCSTAGEIEGERVHDDHVVASAVWLEKSHIATASATLDGAGGDPTALGARLGALLPTDGLVHVVVLSDGTRVNGSALVAGLTRALPAGTGVSGGLAGDGAAMQSTVIVDAGKVEGGACAVVGFYGDIHVGVGSLGGWDAFGPERRITGSNTNVLTSLDGEPALTLYKRYLGEHAAELPSSALLFPLLVRVSPDKPPVVRTVLGVDEATGTMTFAGDVPAGASAQLMRANFDRIVNGASGAAKAAAGQAPQLALLISCVGRKLILKQRIEEEVEAVRDVVGADCALAGFYSYGELAPFASGEPCQLHNQTMTVTTFAEG